MTAPASSAEQRIEATRRGRRLDESKPGSGLGLSIVTDLVALYEGKFSLDRSPPGASGGDRVAGSLMRVDIIECRTP